MRIPLSPSDAFHWLLDRVARRDGGPGNVAQLRLRLARVPADRGAVARGWRALGRQAGMLAARAEVRPWRVCWHAPRAAELILDQRDEPLAAVAARELRRGVDADRGEHARLALALAADEPGAVLTWNHRLFDARGASALIALLPALAAGAALGERWWDAGYREPVALPGARGRGQLARRSLDFIRPLRLARVLTPLPGRRPAAPLLTHGGALGLADTAACDARLRAVVGRFGETPFLLAALAAALEQSFGVGGDVVFPLAVDARAPGESRWLANAHGFLLLRVPSGLASADLAAAARHLRDEHRRWVAGEGMTALLAALSWMPLVGERLARAQLGNFKPGVHASAVAANAGRTLMPSTWFDAPIAAVEHVAAPAGRPGIAALFHRDAQGLHADLTVTGAVAARCPPALFAARLRHQLVERPLAGAP